MHPSAMRPRPCLGHVVVTQVELRYGAGPGADGNLGGRTEECTWGPCRLSAVWRPGCGIAAIVMRPVENVGRVVTGARTLRGFGASGRSSMTRRSLSTFVWQEGRWVVSFDFGDSGVSVFAVCYSLCGGATRQHAPRSHLARAMMPRPASQLPS